MQTVRWSNRFSHAIDNYGEDGLEPAVHCELVHPIQGNVRDISAFFPGFAAQLPRSLPGNGVRDTAGIPGLSLPRPAQKYNLISALQ